MMNVIKAKMIEWKKEKELLFSKCNLVQTSDLVILAALSERREFCPLQRASKYLNEKCCLSWKKNEAFESTFM